MAASNDGVVRVWWIDTSRTFMDINVPPGLIYKAHTTPLYNAKISNDLSFSLKSTKKIVTIIKCTIYIKNVFISVVEGQTHQPAPPSAKPIQHHFRTSNDLSFSLKIQEKIVAISRLKTLT